MKNDLEQGVVGWVKEAGEAEVRVRVEVGVGQERGVDLARGGMDRESVLQTSVARQRLSVSN